MKRKRYSLEEVLASIGVRVPIRKYYTEADMLAVKPHLSSPEGACMIYDHLPCALVSKINRRLKPHNMVWVQRSIHRKPIMAKIVLLDNLKPLPDNYFRIAESVIIAVVDHPYLKAHV